MALDAQSNWNVEMSQLRLSQPTIKSASAVKPPPATVNFTPYDPSKEVHLPTEIILQILSYIPQRGSSQGILWTCCLINRAWYSATVPLLYARPCLGGGNFQQAVATLCPSKNAHIRRSELSEFVRRLDMGELVHDGSKSLTARLLGRLKGGLEEFVAPQASFAINSFAALSKCTKLVYLDLSLISASISIRLLFQTLRSLVNLETLFFPRSSSHDHLKDKDGYAWPPKLRVLHLAGGIDDTFLRIHLATVPPTLERLSIQHCSQVHTSTLQDTLQDLGPQLRHLTVRHPMSQLPRGVLDHTLTWCSNLEALRISADYISNFFFDAGNVPPGHPLRILDLDCSGNAGADVEVSANEVYLAVEEGRLPFLRSVRVSARLAWAATKTTRQDVEDLVELLEEQEMEVPLGIEPGVWTMSS